MSDPTPQFQPPTHQPQYQQPQHQQPQYQQPQHQQPSHQQPSHQQPGAGWVGQQPTHQPAQGHYPQQVAPKPLPDLARGYLSLRAFTQPALGIIFPVLGVFLIGAYGIGISALSGVAGVSLMVALIGWLCMVGGVVTSAVVVRHMVANFLAAGNQFSVLLWLGLLLPCLGFVLMLIAPLTTRYPLAGASTNGLPMLGLFIVCIILVPASGLSQALSVRRVERAYGPAGVAALWALQQGQLAREPEYLAAYAAQRQPGIPGQSAQPWQPAQPGQP